MQSILELYIVDDFLLLPGILSGKSFIKNLLFCCLLKNQCRQPFSFPNRIFHVSVEAHFSTVSTGLVQSNVMVIMPRYCPNYDREVVHGRIAVEITSCGDVVLRD